MKQRGIIKTAQQLDAGNHVPQSYMYPPSTEGTGQTVHDDTEDDKTMNKGEDSPTPRSTSLDSDNVDKVINYLDKALKLFSVDKALPHIKQKKSVLTKQLIKELLRVKQTAVTVQNHLCKKR